MTINELVGQRIRELRRIKGISQEELAHICNLHRTYIGQIERAEKNVTLKNLEKIANALGETVSTVTKF